jgi:hypothetical protein
MDADGSNPLLETESRPGGSEDCTADSDGAIGDEIQAGAANVYAADDENAPDSISRRIFRSTEASSSRLTWLLRNWILI